MTTIVMDPVEMRMVADLVGTQMGALQDTMVGTRAACTCEVPRSLVGWIDDALVEITTEALQAGIAYLNAAIDLKARADEIAVNQSLALQVDPTAGIVGGTVVGGQASDGFTILGSDGQPVELSALLTGTGTVGGAWGGTSSMGASELVGGSTLLGGPDGAGTTSAGLAEILAGSASVGRPSYATMPLIGALEPRLDRLTARMNSGNPAVVAAVAPGYHNIAVAFSAPSGVEVSNGVLTGPSGRSTTSLSDIYTGRDGRADVR
jgi:hypothetical protein